MKKEKAYCKINRRIKRFVCFEKQVYKERENTHTHTHTHTIEEKKVELGDRAQAFQNKVTSQSRDRQENDQCTYSFVPSR